MSIDKAIGVVRTEKRCIEKSVSGCSNDCFSCSLMQPSELVSEAYEIAIECMIYKKMNEDDRK